MEWNDILRDSVQRTAPYIIWVVLALATSILVALIRDPVSRVLQEAGEQLRALRSRVLTRSAIALGRKSHRFWLARQHEPARTLAASLERLAEALPNVGKKSLERITVFQTELKKQLGTLEALGLRPPSPRMGPMDAASTTAAPRGSWWRLLLLAGIAILTGAANSFLLNEFFQGVITSDAVFPSAFPDFHVSHVFAVLIFMMEVAIGFALHHFAQEHQDESAARRVLAQAPWLVLVGLVWLEGWAYALLSYQIDIPERLNLSANGGLYTFARYFLALFGAGLTLLLASLGYLLGQEIERLHSGKEARRQDRVLTQYGWLISGGTEQIGRTVRTLSHLRAEAQSFPLELVHQFKREVEATSSSENLQAAVRDTLAEILESGRQVGAVESWVDRLQARGRRPIRTRAQALAHMSLFTTALGLVVLVSWVSVEYVAAFVRGVQGNRPSASLFALISGVVMTAFALAAGYIAGHSWSGTRYGSGTGLLSSSSSGQRLLRVLAALLLLTAGAALVAVAVANQTLGPSTALNVLLGLLHAGILGILGAAADTAMANTLHVLQLVGLHLTRFLVSLGAVGLWMVRASLAVLDWVVRLVAVFGQLVVRPRPPVPAGVVEFTRVTSARGDIWSPGRRITDRVRPPVVRGNHD